MEPYKLLKLDELQKNEATDTANCRFRHGLNTNCQIKVLQYLSLNDLLTLSKMDSYFKEVIMRWVISTRLIKLNVPYPDGNLEMFEAFGKSFRKLRVKGNEFNFILETIVKYCSQNTLTELEIIVTTVLTQLLFPQDPPMSLFTNSNVTQRYDLKKIDLPMSLFTYLQKLRLECDDNSELFLDHLKKIADHALNLKILQVRGNRIQGEWLRTKHMQNLQELWLHTSRNMSIDDLTSFLRNRPKLKVFSFAGKDDITTIGKRLAKYCSGLEKFCYQDLNDNQDYNNLRREPTDRYDFLSTFSNLNSWTLNSSSAFSYFLMALASNNIKELIIHTDLFKKQCKIKYNAIMQTMKVGISGDSTKTEQYELNCNFITSVLSQLKKNIPNITFISLRLASFNRIIELIPNVRILSISNVDFKYLPVEIRKIVRTIRNMQRDTKSDQYLIKLIVNQNQWRELEVYEDIESIMSISIDFNSSWYSTHRNSLFSS